MNVDFGRTAHEYDRYRSGFPDALFSRLAAQQVGLPGQRVLDLGTGSGQLARAFSARGCRVVGIDASEQMLAKAREQTEDAAVSYRVGNAERLRFDDGSFDVVTAGESWHWFKKAKVLRELRHVLRPGGRLAIVSYDWVPLPENVVDATEALIETYNPELARRGGTGLHAEWLQDVRCAGFSHIETFSFDVVLPHSPEAWRGRVRNSAAVQGSMAPGKVERFDERLRSELARRFPGDELRIPFCCWALIASYAGAPSSNPAAQ